MTSLKSGVRIVLMKGFIIIILIILINVGYKQYKKFESKKRNEQRYQICMQTYNDASKCKHGYSSLLEKLKKDNLIKKNEKNPE